MRIKFNGYWVTIGLEIHISLETKEKLFSSAPNSFNSDGKFELFDAGIPGILPRLSKEPVEMAIAFGLATNSEIREISYFDRKHYMYPDLPLGYQITQQYKPILWAGEVEIKETDGTLKKVIIEHSHLECDAAKSLHDIYNNYTAIDLSRCSAPLIEVVSTPCLYSPFEAKEYAKKVYALSVFMGICDGKIEEGSFRVDASISLNKNPDILGTRVEIKNISSFGYLEDALNFEIERQSNMLDKRESILMETRLYNEKDMHTHSMRSKETVAEYRYLPCPDIPALLITKELIKEVQDKYDTNFFSYIEKVENLFNKLKIKYDNTLFNAYWKPFTGHLWKYLLSVPQLHTERAVRLLSFWILEVLDERKILSIDDFNIIYESSLQAKEVKDMLKDWQKGEKDLKEYMPQFMSFSEVQVIIQNVVNNFPIQIEKFKKGDTKIFNFFVGKIMAETKGKASAQIIKDCLTEYLLEV